METVVACKRCISKVGRKLAFFIDPALSVLDIVAGNQIAYPDAQSPRSCGECWIKCTKRQIL